jgi:DNA-binding transcriptional MocR family regulator
MRQRRASQPIARTTPEAPVPVDVSQRLMRVLQTGVQPGVVPLAAALPSSTLLPLAALQAALRRRRAAPSAAARRRQPHQHGPTGADPPARPVFGRLGRTAGASEFVITNSCTEALGLCLRAVTHPGDTVAVESPAIT